MRTQKKCVEAKKEVNSMREGNDGSNGHMVERPLVGPYGQWPTPADGARPSKSVASSHESRAGNAGDRTGRRERTGEMGARDHGEKRKQYTARRLPFPNSNNSNNTHQQ